GGGAVARGGGGGGAGGGGGGGGFSYRLFFWEAPPARGVVVFGGPPGGWRPPLYPPFYYLWCVPLSWFDYRTSAYLFTALTTAALVASTALIAGPGARARGALGWWVAASLCYLPVLDSLVGGQKGTLFLLVFAITYRLLAKRRVFLAGAAFGLAAVKPQLMLVLLLVMLIQREWRFFAGLAATGAVLGAQSLIVGWKPLLDWVAEM